jgi:antirestriction protein ArdC
MTKTAAPRADVYAKVTDKIIADLEQGVRTWMRPWSAEHIAGKIMRPRRHNGVPYKGINVIMLVSLRRGPPCGGEELIASLRS